MSSWTSSWKKSSFDCSSFRVLRALATSFGEILEAIARLVSGEYGGSITPGLPVLFVVRGVLPVVYTHAQHYSRNYAS